MATPRLSMRKTRGILRRVLEHGRSGRQVSASADVGSTTVLAAVRMARTVRLTSDQVQAMTEDALESKLCPTPVSSACHGPGPIGRTCTPSANDQVSLVALLPWTRSGSTSSPFTDAPTIKTLRLSAVARRPPGPEALFYGAVPRSLL